VGVARRGGGLLALVLVAVLGTGCTAARKAPPEPGSFEVPERSGTFDVLGYPQLVAAGAGAVWVLNPPGGDEGGTLVNQGALLRVDPSTGGRPVMRFHGVGDGSLAVGEGAAWITEPASATLTRYALGSGEVSVQKPFGAGRTPLLMAVGAGFVWVTWAGPGPRWPRSTRAP
jgi:hypothetical protein